MTSNGKPKIAFFDFTSCEGCQLTVVDSLQTHPELLQVVEIVQFREAMSERGEDYQVAFIEGSCTRPSDERRLQEIRQQAALVVALGTCAHLGGVNALKALHPLDEIRSYVYGDKAEQYETYDARPIEAVIKVDFAIPGCPIDRDEFLACVKALLLGKKPPIPDYPVCVECKLKENTCLFTLGKVCLGPVTRAGCKAICPSYGQSCEACRGYITNPNDPSMRLVLGKHGLTPEEIMGTYTMFTTYQVRQKMARQEQKQS
jgi:coenzyme F420-reducing hydrogenase gamma subunit